MNDAAQRIDEVPPHDATTPPTFRARLLANLALGLGLRDEHELRLQAARA